MMNIWQQALKPALLVILCAVLGACASVDFDYPKSDTRVLSPVETGDTFLGKALAPILAGKPQGEAGFFLLSDAVDALAARLLMAERAEKTIDAQYYLLSSDVVGFAFLNSLLKAADRGVRVRLLLDDIQTQGYDAGMAGLDSHPNFEIRIFNPFASRSARAWDGITQFSRINRRMHNKSFTVDSQMTIIGGRNIAAEYFGAREDSRFGDLDVIGVGPVVQDVGDMFDTYWNYIAAAPIPAFAKIPADPAAALAQVRQRISESNETILDSPYAEAVRTHLTRFIDSDGSAFTWAPYTLAYDSPDKSNKKLAAEAASITTPLFASISGATEEVIIISPYFIPRKTGQQAIIEMIDRGIDVSVITNSYGANNHKSVHAGYMPSRKPLLEGGAHLYEVRPDADIEGSEYTATEESESTLHTKAFVVDRRDLFVGSFNFDPRSANINTELGVIIHSPALASNVAELVVAALPTVTYEVFLNKDEKLRWREWNDGQETILKKEPDTTQWNRFTLGFFRMLPIRGQL